MRIARRSLLLAASLAATPFPSWAQGAQSGLSRGVFSHGVASGDPLTDRVIIWTRFVPAGDGRIGWEVARDEAFADVVARGHAAARFANDFCVKVDVGGLPAGGQYYYRFVSASGPSVTGMTRTAPDGAAESLTIALFSCANFPFGYYHAYRDAAADPSIDLAVHVGDYIYEVPRGVYPGPDEAVPGRIIDPVTETVSLSDYYLRYASYHTDPDLLELRRLKPLCVVWDDHEIANDTWKDGAQAHNPNTEGAFADRVAAATKAYFDWMPIRRPDQRGPRIYRSLDWGNLARIVLTDTRYIGRDHQIDLAQALFANMAEDGSNMAQAIATFRRDYLDQEGRSLMGMEQEAWFAHALGESKSRGQTWQIIAQQIVMGDQVAAQGMDALLPDDVSPGSRRWFSAGVAMGAAGLGWNMDSWTGYPAAKRRLLEACASYANNAVVLAGDSHNCWINNLPAPNQSGRLAAVEFAGGSVSSPGFERSLTNAEPGQRESLMQSANPELAFCDITNRGYGKLRFTATSCDAEWRAWSVPDNKSPAPIAPIVTRMSTTPSAEAGPGAWDIATA